MPDSRTRNALLVSALIAAFAIAAFIVGTVYQYFYQFALFAPQFSRFELSHAASVGSGTLLDLVGVIIRTAVFCAGVFVSLRWVAPVGAGDAWGWVIRRGVIAAAFGAAASLVLALVEGIFGAFGSGAHPFGYALDPSFDAQRAGNGVVDALASLLSPFLTWLPLVVLAVVLLRLWLARQVDPSAKV